MAKLRAFWQRTNEGLSAPQLWSQFRREVRSGLDLYSAETGRDLREAWSGRRGPFRVLAAVVGAMYRRLTPVRRLLFVLALVLMIVPTFEYSGARGPGFVLIPARLAAEILLVLLVLELAARVELKRDVEIARDIQRMLLPEKAPKIAGFDIAFGTKAANTVAGDYYDAFLRPNTNGSRLLLIVADVAGKGIPAGITMAAVQSVFHTLAAEPLPSTELVTKLNHSMCARSGGGRHLTTAFIAELDTATRSMTWVNAGQNPPILLRNNGAIEYLEAGGLPLGAFATSQYQSGSTNLGSGDALYIYTDGISEAVNESGAEYGADRLVGQLAELGRCDAATSLTRIFASADRFAGAVPQYDDMTCLVLRAEGAPSAAASGVL